MPNPYFRFKQFTVYHDQCAMKVTTDSCLFGAWCARELQVEGNKKMDTDAHRLLDIGTGTGLLSLMVAQKNTVLIQAVEIDPPAALQAAENVAQSPYRNQIEIIQDDIRLLQGTGVYDYIICNPPFYQNELTSGSVAKNTAHHSHQLVWEELFTTISKLLKPEGLFFLLLPAKRKDELQSLLAKEGLYVNTLILVQQSVTHSPFRLLVKGSKKPTSIVEESISIKDEQQQYTPAFTGLLKDYYLYL